MGEDYLPVSQLNTFVFCPRRFYYQHVLGEWSDNAHTLKGSYYHERAHAPGQETRSDQTVLRSVMVFSDRLRLTGKLDVLEVRDGRFYPVEYKSGAVREDGGVWLNDAVQLCALALCLEERTGQAIERGAVFTFKDRRRTEVVFDPVLRALTEGVVEAARALTVALQAPPPDYTRRCEGCSLRMHCLPQEVAQLRRLPEVAGGLPALVHVALCV
ncbi:MAG: CRISPR-associated protein Cas4 [Chloroherpetonaceae bacterium]|nr:CRISPR-associated protein Cas4 [Chthonomonadaceae bacterium]MDW8209288.1 CRISPR-associated protein Cas4 [Chloroherpetonaceae bacterium]